MERYGPYYLYVHIMCYSNVGINGEQGSPLHITVEATHKVVHLPAYQIVRYLHKGSPDHGSPNW
jgi:hypothetical protein